MRFLLLPATALLCLVAFGCSAETAPPSTDDADLIDQPSGDTTVLKVRIGEAINGYGEADFDRPHCAALLASGRVDCTEQMEQRFGAPVLHQIDLPADSNQFFCRVLHVTTLTKKAAADVSTGIGFYYKGYTGQGRFIPKAKLKKVGDVTRKDGSAGELHEFLALASCWLGSGSSSSFARYDFKPYIQFEASGQTYRNWDEVGANHTVTGSHYHWDRSGDLLR
jgi:hypothetical protein